MEKEIMDDVKKYQKLEKLKKWRDEVQPIPWYFDGLENLCDRIHPDKQFLQVTDIKQLSKDTKLFRFVSAKPNKLLAPFRAGQYIGLIVDINGVRTSRPFSLASSPNQLAYYELGVKRKVGGFVSNYLLEKLKIGDILEATEPLGDLYYNRTFHGKDLVFIAGGSGITPFISLLKYISEQNFKLNIWLFFGCLSEDDILFKDELDDIQTRRPNIKIQYILSEPGPNWDGPYGFITKDKILDAIKSIENKFFYIVGNRAMYSFIQEQMKELGVPRHRVIYEFYGVPDDVTRIVGWPKDIKASSTIKVTIEFIQRGRKVKEIFDAQCVEPLLNSLEREKDLGIMINNGCRSGACALCRTKLVSGKIFMLPEVTMREIDQDYGYIHPCVSYPLTDIHIDLTLI
ncbi:MAG: iron-sulfur cluster-binding domain-containing protein [Candidatus Lokiarchaeota archaeon]|nr:iron-sulfur cluster-binding domain-containing protein [Candidatus Lokiarchaeota archaeon]